MNGEKDHTISYWALIIGSLCFYVGYKDDLDFMPRIITTLAMVFIGFFGVGSLDYFLNSGSYGERFIPRFGMMYFFGAVPISFAFVNLMEFGAGLAQGYMLNVSQTGLLAFWVAGFFYAVFYFAEIATNIIWHDIWCFQKPQYYDDDDAAAEYDDAEYDDQEDEMLLDDESDDGSQIPISPRR